MKKAISVSTLINTSIALVWKDFTSPAAIMQWNTPNKDWHTPRAENDLREGGRFNYRMEAKDKTQGFDFSGKYIKVIPYTLIEYVMDDGRKVVDTFSSTRDGIKVTSTFETEPTHSEAAQREGWQAVLDHFKKYVEAEYGVTKPQLIKPCLWFDNQAEEAVRFYSSIFKDAKEGLRLYFTEAGQEIHGHKPDDLMSIDFRINGQWMTALNGGPLFKFNEALSLQILCETQAEIDHYWERLLEDGEEIECGWLRDKFGLCWQVIPTILDELLKDPARAERVTAAYLKMTKLDIDALLQA